MPSVTDFVEPKALARLATPANLRLGQEIVDQRGVVVKTSDPSRIVAKVGGVPASDQRRTVELVSEPSGLRWTCTCSRRPDLFCKHCVATALVARREASSKPAR
jgi:uncharacterized Zn finger protein